MNWVFVVVFFALGGYLSGAGLLALLTSRPLALTGSKRTWRSQDQAVAFCLLFGGSLLTAGLIAFLIQAQVIDGISGLWLQLLPAGLLVVAIAVFRPRPQAQPQPDHHSG
ncbi:hypothetical protein [Actinoplanes flavus]|uniref:Uncharacterized protein n=1 Tax=Actinoplanes flavus TaxID=2820290 RepID=A0ABS3V0K4_9ACTN|nr:hypothetical protein [Actinoplanes flavus]MBO3744363.1 hypothetical protein [Actinoplanes flavus]